MISKIYQNSNVLEEARVPAVVIDIPEAERMMLTIRINRAKGNHVAFKMHEVVKRLVADFGLSVGEIQNGIGATKDEVELLLQEGVFSSLDIKNHEYSKSWIPGKVGRAK